jgi:predicted Zn finger-like uncharacterized protein
LACAVRKKEGQLRNVRDAVMAPQTLGVCLNSVSGATGARGCGGAHDSCEVGLNLPRCVDVFRPSTTQIRMIVATCPQCSARFKLSEEQTRGRSSVKMKCSRCGTVFQHALGEVAVAGGFDGPAPRTLAGIPAIPGSGQPVAGGQTMMGRLPPTETMGLHPSAQGLPPGRDGSITGFDDLFGPAAAAAAPAPAPPVSSRAAGPAEPAVGLPRRSTLDELASMNADSAAPFMDDLMGGGPLLGRGGDAFGRGNGSAALSATAAAPAPAPPVGRTTTAVPPAENRSPLDDLSGFTGMNAGAPARDELPPAPVARSPFDDISGLQKLPAPRMEGQLQGEQPGGVGLFSGAFAAPGAAKAPAIVRDPFSLPEGSGTAVGQKPPVGAKNPAAGSSRSSAEDDALPLIGDGKTVVPGGKKTFYPMLEFRQEFGALDDEPPISPLASAAATARPLVADNSRPRTQAMNMPASLIDPIMPGGRGGTEGTPGARVERETSDDSALLDLAANRAPQKQLTAEEMDRVRFDVVGDAALRNQPRVPYDQAILGSLAVFLLVALAGIGWAASRNEGVFDFRDPARMWGIATGSVQPGDETSQSTLANAVIIGDAVADPRAAAALSVVRLSSVVAGRYQAPGGPLLAVVEGTITNTSSQPLRRLMVEVRLVDGQDVNRTVLVVPAGTSFENTHLDAIRDAETLGAAVSAAVLRTADFELPAGQSTRFSAVFVPSDDLEPTGLTPVVLPVSAEQSGAASCWAPLTLGLPAEQSAAVALDGSGAVAEGSATDGSSAAPAADGSVEGSTVPAEASAAPAAEEDVEAP